MEKERIPAPVQGNFRDAFARVTGALRRLLEGERDEARRGELELALEDALALARHFDHPVLSSKEELARRALHHVEENMDNVEYSVDDLANDLGLCRSNLYRGLYAATGLTPSVFIRQVRVQRAAHLLESSLFRVSEIAYMVGFNSLKHFNRHFKEAFGVPPSIYRRDKGMRKSL